MATSLQAVPLGTTGQLSPNRAAVPCGGHGRQVALWTSTKVSTKTSTNGEILVFRPDMPTRAVKGRRSRGADMSVPAWDIWGIPRQRHIHDISAPALDGPGTHQ